MEPNNAAQFFSLVLVARMLCAEPLAGERPGHDAKKPRGPPVVFQNTGALGDAIAELEEVVKNVCARA